VASYSLGILAKLLPELVQILKKEAQMARQDFARCTGHYAPRLPVEQL
jgi:hypothetical protein